MVVKDYSMQARDNNSSTGNSCVDNNRDNGKVKHVLAMTYI